MGRKSLVASERVDLTYGWGARIAVARRSRNLTQAELGALIGVNQALISRWEASGFRPEPEAQARLAAALEYPVSDLFPRDAVEARDRLRLQPDA